ncbi:MAG TPA: peptidylprolyl isomerase [Acidobacteriaceae bacterium]|jgi:peptidyl-prolyl cis-trans isomerase A (cyclophilin A)|nr:peptidylprolyl isomerase [Acidobacteriaceae bacterium]
MISIRTASRFSIALSAAVLLSCSVFAQQTPSTVPDAPVPSAQQAPAQTAPADQTAPTQELPGAPESHAAPLPTGPTVLFDTSMGRMACKLFDKEAPEAVANFVGLATGTKEWTDPTTHQKVTGKPFFDGTTFHRVIPDFMIQGGDPMGTGEGGPGYEFKDEFDPNLNFDVAGRLAMANSGPDTNGSQFFITEAPQPHLDQHYTIFGQCDDPSVWVVRSIARVNRDSNDKPVDPVVLKTVTVIPAGQPVPPAPSAPANAPANGPSASAAPQP